VSFIFAGYAFCGTTPKYYPAPNGVLKKKSPKGASMQLIHKTIRLNKSLLDQLDQKVENSSNIKTRSALIREILLKHVNKHEINRSVAFLDELKMFRQEFARIGGNLNQIAKSYNTSEQLNYSDLEKTHEELRQEFKKIIKELKIINRNF
jgi:predicted DNA-binding protein YlxM (UPF0122 family)